MDVLKALKAEESKFRHQLETIQDAIKILGGNGSRGVEGNGRRNKRHWHMSAAAKARISKAQKARWGEDPGREESVRVCLFRFFISVPPPGGILGRL